MEHLQTSLFSNDSTAPTERRRSRSISASQRSPSADHEFALLLDFVKQLEASEPVGPLQCVTYKMNLHEYQRMRATAKKWKIKYSDLLRMISQSFTSALDQPTPELLEALEENVRRELAREAARALKRRRETLAA